MGCMMWFYRTWTPGYNSEYIDPNLAYNYQRRLDLAKKIAWWLLFLTLFALFITLLVMAFRGPQEASECEDNTTPMQAALSNGSANNSEYVENNSSSPLSNSKESDVITYASILGYDNQSKNEEEPPMANNSNKETQNLDSSSTESSTSNIVWDDNDIEQDDSMGFSGSTKESGHETSFSEEDHTLRLDFQIEHATESETPRSQPLQTTIEVDQTTDNPSEDLLSKLFGSIDDPITASFDVDVTNYGEDHQSNDFSFGSSTMNESELVMRQLEKVQKHYNEKFISNFTVAYENN